MDNQTFVLVWAVLFNLIITSALFYISTKKDFSFGLRSISVAFFILELRFFCLLFDEIWRTPILFPMAEILSLSSGCFLIHSYFKLAKKKIKTSYLYLLFVSGTASILILYFLQIGLPYLAIPNVIVTSAGFFLLGLGFFFHREFSPNLKKVIAYIAWIIAIHRLNYPITLGIDYLKPWGYLINGTLVFALGVGIIIIFQLIHQKKLIESNEELEAVQKKIKEINLRLLILNNQTPAILYSIRLDPSPHFDYVNYQASNLTGYSIQEFYEDKEILEKIIFHRDKEKFALFVEGTSPILLRWVHKNGKILWTEHYTTIVSDESGHPISIDGVALNVTETKNAEKSLALEKNLNLTVFENAASLLIITSKQGLIENFNSSAEHLMGINRYEAIGKFIYDIMLLATDRKALQDLIEDISDFQYITESITLRCISKDNQIRFLEWRLGTIKNRTGEIIKIIWIGIDQTLKRKAEIELNELNKSLENKILERTLELQNKNSDLNKALENLSKTQEKLIHSEKLASLGQLIAGLSHEINNPIGAIKASTETLHREWEDDYSSKNRQVIEDNILELTKLSDINIGLTTGITNRKLRKELKTKLETKGIKLAEAYAELLTDAGVVDVGNDDLDLISSCDSPETYSQLRRILVINGSMNHIFSATKRLARITYALKNFAGIQSDSALTPYKLEDTIYSALNLYKDHFTKTVTLVTKFEFDGHIHCNPSDLIQMWSNFILNSLQAMNYQGTLTLRTGVKGNFIEVSIEDTGSGISEENRSKIFQPFFSTKEAGDGVGLGLYLIKEIVKHHHGQVSFESKETRTKFLVQFPI
ncbi:PAS domain-containing sensor histidine kinase [Leptospira ilyithenensis]|uniref:histidine kinase n=1 Tax=Leptospira ilyithenensis TaxID=2484901 RepID=A0A4R9LSI8_9LEPT|nr:ATP-binding protein [Leptospira ilyithenensis]TGN10374.1 PAS domain S-box protein [Leptospira ilyithenensis]